MKQNTLFGIALWLMLVATVGTGAVNAKDKTNPSQAGKSSIYTLDVAASDSHGKGKLMVDVDKRTFVFNGQDFEPSMQIFLRARAAGSAHDGIYAIGNTTPSGNLHISGTWEGEAVVTEVVADISYPPIYAFSLYNSGGFVAQLACYYSTDSGATWKESEHINGITVGMDVLGPLYALGVPEHASVKIHVEVVAGKDRTGTQVFKFDSDAYWDIEYIASYEIHGTTWNPALEYYGCFPVGKGP